MYGAYEVGNGEVGDRGREVEGRIAGEASLAEWSRGYPKCQHLMLQLQASFTPCKVGESWSSSRRPQTSSVAFVSCIEI